VPLSAHALFARPLVLSPGSAVDVEVLPGGPGGVVWCDGRRSTTVREGMEVQVFTGKHKLLLARTSEQPFVTRLVRKFGLPVDGWRGRSEDAALIGGADAGGFGGMRVAAPIKVGEVPNVDAERVGDVGHDVIGGAGTGDVGHMRVAVPAEVSSDGQRVVGLGSEGVGEASESTRADEIGDVGVADAG
jgi:hypothetical protein